MIDVELIRNEPDRIRKGLKNRPTPRWLIVFWRSTASGGKG